MTNAVEALKWSISHDPTPKQTEAVAQQPKKVSKASVLYLHRTGTDYQCKNCVLFQPAKERCWIHSSSTPIKPEATCGLYVKGKPHPAFQSLDPIGAVSKQESGYSEESANGYSCKRCEYFLPDTLDCQKVDRSSEGDDPGKIHPDACCNAFEVNGD